MKLIILGLDGATFDIINRYNEKHLPNLKAIISKGSYGVLKSTFPPITGPAWMALATGKNPGKTGIFDFLNRDSSKNFKMKIISSNDYRLNGSFWDFLSDKNNKIGIWNYPLLFPPYPINGFMISGLGTSPEEEFTYPKNIKKKLLDLCKGYNIEIPYITPRYKNKPSLFISDVKKLIKQNKEIISFLINKNIDVFFGVISVSDFIHHYMWKYIDKTHPLYDIDEAKKFSEEFLKLWKEIDEIIGILLLNMSKKTNLLIISDHGFGALNQSFYINSWLQSQGFLFRKKWNNGFIALVQGLILNFSEKISKFNFKMFTTFFKKIFRKFSRFNKSFISNLNMKKTIAFAAYHTRNSGNIYLNTLNKSIRSLSIIEKLKREIIQKLEYTCKKLNLKITIYTPNEIYNGKYLNLAPDILFEINNFECSIHYTFNKFIFSNKPYSSSQSGSHRREGIFIAYGPDIREDNEIKGAKIYDIAPTILHMFDIPISNDKDGRVLKEIFREDSKFAKNEINFELNNKEQKIIKEKVKELKKLVKL